MKAFKRLIARLAREGSQLDEAKLDPSQLVSRDSYEGEADFNITVKAAIGGRIVQFRHYDRVKDRNHYRTYIITDAEPFEDSLGKIITMESMRL
jgi:hypothetical protein